MYVKKGYPGVRLLLRVKESGEKKKRVLSLPSLGAFGGSFTYEPNLPEKDK